MSSASRISYDDVVAWVRLLAERLHAAREYLTELDSTIGDADHGINMDRGLHGRAWPGCLASQGDVGALRKGVGMTLISTVGGASGPLYGTFFLRLGRGDGRQGRHQLG